MSSDAIVILKNDHKEIRKLFSDFEKLGDGAHKRKGQLVSKMIEPLTVHTYLENEVMYPRVRELLPEVEDDVLEPYEEHHVADVLVMELDAMKPDAERFDRQDHGADRERPPPHRGRGRGVVPEGAGRAVAQGAAGDRRRDGGKAEEGSATPIPARSAQEDGRRCHQVTPSQGTASAPP